MSVAPGAEPGTSTEGAGADAPPSALSPPPPPVPADASVSTAMIGVPTSTVWPSGTNSSATTPANGVGSSTSDLAVSISTTMSLVRTVSPGLTFQVTISASVSPSPTSGRRNCFTSDMSCPSSVGERAVDGVEHTIEVRQELLLELARRVRQVEPADAQHRRLEVVEAALGQPRRDLGAHAQEGRRLVHDDEPAGLLHRRGDGVDVQRRE